MGQEQHGKQWQTVVLAAADLLDGLDKKAITVAEQIAVLALWGRVKKANETCSPISVVLFENVSGAQTIGGIDPMSVYAEHGESEPVTSDMFRGTLVVLVAWCNRRGLKCYWRYVDRGLGYRSLQVVCRPWPEPTDEEIRSLRPSDSSDWTSLSSA